MADGDLKWGSGYVARAIGQVAHTDGNATVVASIALPSTDGVYQVTARVTGSTATHTNAVWGLAHAQAWVDGGAAAVGGTTESRGDATGYTIAFTVSGLNLRISVTAANGHRSVALIEVFGVEMALAIG